MFGHKLILIALILSLSFSMTSCFGVITRGIAKKKYTEENGAIPPDFMKKESTLVCIIKNRKSYDKYLRKNIQKNYHGKVEFVLNSKLVSEEKYNDLEEYRYLFDYGSGSSYSWSGSGGVAFTTKQFFVVDRKEEKLFTTAFSSSSFANLILAYATKLEEKRQEQQSNN